MGVKRSPVREHDSERATLEAIMNGTQRVTAGEFLGIAVRLGLDPVDLFRDLASRQHLLDPLLRRHA